MIELFILDFIQAHCRSAALDVFFPAVTKFGDAGLFWIAVCAVLILFPHKRKTGIAVVFAFALDVIICNIFLKNLCARPRPYNYRPELELLVARLSDYSFPSGHTALSFTAVSTLFFRKEKLWIPALVLAILIAFSRLYLFVHFPTDVLAGAVFGVVFGYLGALLFNLAERTYRKGKKRIISPLSRVLP